MKKTIRNLLAVALSTQMVFSLSACGSKKKDSVSAGDAAAGSSGDTKSSVSLDQQASAQTKVKSGTIIKESDPYFNVNACQLNAKVDESRKIRFSSLSNHVVAGDLIVAEVFIHYEIPDEVSKEMDSLNLNDEKQLDRYIQIENEYNESSLQLFNLNGEVIATMPLEDNNSFIGAYPGTNGEIIIVCSKYNPKDCAATPTLFVMNNKGEKVRDIQLQVSGDLFDVRVYALENGNFLLASTGKFYLLDSEGKQIGEQADPNLNGTLICSDGKWYAVMPQYGAEELTTYIREIDTTTGKFKGDQIKTSNSILSAQQGERDCFLLNSNGIEKIDPVSQERTPVLAWKDTDINSATLDLTGGRITSENEMVFFQRQFNPENGREDMDAKAGGAKAISAVKLTKADKNPHAGKALIKLGINGDVDEDFLEKVLEYNQDTSKSARIVVCDYTASFDNIGRQDEYEKAQAAAVDQLTLDMLSGEGPDIIVGFSDISQINDASMLVDLNTYIDKDSSIDRENYFDNIFRAFETDGKLYTIPLTYSIEGLAVNGKYEGAKENWTYADFEAMADKLPDGKLAISSKSYNDLLKSWMMHLSSRFIDYENKTVDFESDEFKQLLQTVKKHGQTKQQGMDTQGSPAMMDSYFNLNDDIAFMNDMVAACSATLSDLQMYGMLTKNTRDNVFFTGVPSLSGTGMTVRGHLTMAVAAYSPNPDQAWDFISSFLSEDVQQQISLNTAKFPINRNAFDTNCNIEIEVNQNNIKQMREEIKNLPPEKTAGADDAIVELTKEKADGLKALIESVKTSQSCDTDVMSIILEEAAGFFADQRSIDDVCRNIQNRASIVVQER